MSTVNMITSFIVVTIVFFIGIFTDNKTEIEERLLKFVYVEVGMISFVVSLLIGKIFGG